MRASATVVLCSALLPLVGCSEEQAPPETHRVRGEVMTTPMATYVGRPAGTPCLPAAATRPDGIREGWAVRLYDENNITLGRSNLSTPAMSERGLCTFEFDAREVKDSDTYNVELGSTRNVESLTAAEMKQDDYRVVIDLRTSG